MFLELLDLYDDYSSNKKLADYKFINQVFIIVNKYHPLGEHLTQVFVSNKGSEYISLTKTINIDLSEISKTYSIAKKKISYEDYIYLYNLIVIGTIFHELEHVYQEELKISKTFNIEKALLVLSDPLAILEKLEEDSSFIDHIKIYIKLRRHRRYYNKNHNRAPHERIANLRSYANTIAMLNDYDKENNGLLFFYAITKDSLQKQLLNGYQLVGDITNSPSLDYIVNMKYGNNDLIVRDNFFHDMKIDTKTRILCGLELTKDEYIGLYNDTRSK